MKKHLLFTFLLLATIACDEGLDRQIDENAKNLVLGASSVKQMAKKCETPSDIKEGTQISGNYQLETTKPTWAPYPRHGNNIIVEKLNLRGETSPLQKQLSIENHQGNLKVKLSLLILDKLHVLEGLQGKIHTQENDTYRICFYGPADIKVDDLTTEAFLYAEGALTSNPSNTIKNLTISFGVSVQIKDKYPQHLSMQQTVNGQLQEAKTGLFISFNKGPQTIAGPYVDQEVALTSSENAGDVIVASKLAPREARLANSLPDRIELKLPLSTGSHTALKLIFNNTSESPSIESYDDCNCELSENDSAMLKGKFECYQENGTIHHVSGQFTIVESD